MNIQDILRGFYSHINETRFDNLNQIIFLQDVRVENYFLIQFAGYLDELFEQGEILSFSLQKLISKEKRNHLDIQVIDKDGNCCYIELKHFTISQMRGKSRNFRFYTNNSNNGKKVGILKDCIKFDELRENGLIKKKHLSICCAVITNCPSIEEYDGMEKRFALYGDNELSDWNLVYPVSKEQQQQNYIGIFTLQK